MAKQIVKMILNGQEIEQLVDSRTLLVHFLREQMNLTGAHIVARQVSVGLAL